MKVKEYIARSELATAFWELRRGFLLVGLLSMLANLLMLTPTIYMLQVYDRFFKSQSGTTLIAVSVVALYMLGLMSTSEWLRTKVLVRLGKTINRRLADRVFSASFESKLAGKDRYPAQFLGELTSLRQFITGNGALSFFDAPWTPIYLMVVFFLHPILGFISIIFVFNLALLAIYSNKNTRLPVLKTLDAKRDLSGYIQGKIRNAEVIYILGMLGNLRNRWLALYQVYIATEFHGQNKTQKVQALSKFVRYTQQSLMLGAGGYLVAKGQLNAGAMIAANVLMGRCLQPIDTMVGSWSGWLSARKSFETLDHLLAANPERPTGIGFDLPVGALDIQHLFAYTPGLERAILKDICIEFTPGTVTAVIGPSGSGKSTFAKSLMGVWPNSAGAVLLDGAPIGDYDREALGPYLGYLPQDIELFEGSVAENIARFGAVVPDKVIDAAKKVGIHDMILKFPNGYDTPMGFAGSRLSGGQRQRIGLARAVYDNPKVVILDEPNANLDKEGEIGLVNLVNYLRDRGTTVLVVTHRKHILNIVDQIVVFADGKIAGVNKVSPVAG